MVLFHTNFFLVFSKASIRRKQLSNYVCLIANYFISNLSLHCNCVAPEETEQQEDVTASYELLQQQLKQANETVATLLSEQEPSQLFTVLLLSMLYTVFQKKT